MISPSSLSAMISRHLGKELRSTASEWYRPASNRVDKSAKSPLPLCLIVDDFPCMRVEARTNFFDELGILRGRQSLCPIRKGKLWMVMNFHHESVGSDCNACARKRRHHVRAACAV